MLLDRAASSFHDVRAVALYPLMVDLNLMRIGAYWLSATSMYLILSSTIRQTPPPPRFDFGFSGARQPLPGPRRSGA
jgi:hypothetical protein